MNCGSKLPDGAKFCSNCGASTSQQGASSISSETPSPQVPQNSTATDINQIRKTLISIAVKYPGDGEVTMEMAQEMAALTYENLEFWKNLTPRQVGQLVETYNFSYEEKRSVDQPGVLLSYLKNLMRLADLTSETLMHGAFELVATLFYAKLLQEYANANKWRDYDRIAMDYLELAEGANVSWLLALALERAAAGKYKLGDKRNARTLLDRFDQVVSTAYRVRPSYTTLEEGSIPRYLKVAQDEASQIRRRL
jgi:hypothetical protein